jgi:hypothetical protein
LLNDRSLKIKCGTDIVRAKEAKMGYWISAAIMVVMVTVVLIRWYRKECGEIVWRGRKNYCGGKVTACVFDNPTDPGVNAKCTFRRGKYEVVCYDVDIPVKVLEGEVTITNLVHYPRQPRRFTRESPIFGFFRGQEEPVDLLVEVHTLTATLSIFHDNLLWVKELPLCATSS